MSLRMCLNLTSAFDRFGCGNNIKELFTIMKDVYRADQVTLRILYAGNDNSPENNWVLENAAWLNTRRALKSYVKENGTLLGRLPYGAYKYGLDGMSVVIDNDSMGKDTEDIDSYKYLILRPDCKLYSSWDEKGSLVF